MSLKHRADVDSPALDLIRFIAAVLVLVNHVRTAVINSYAMLPASQHNEVTASLFFLTRLGHEAVLIFFVLSGLLVGSALIERTSQGSFDLRRYAINRCSRIFVPLVPACLFAALVQFVVAPTAPAPWAIACNMIGLNGVLCETLPTNPPLWSLSYEIGFYVIGGCLALMWSGRSTVTAFLALTAALIAFSVLEFRYLVVWLLGAVSMYAFRPKLAKPQLLISLALIGLGVVTYQLSRESRTLAVLSVDKPVSEMLIAIGIAGVLPMLLARRVSEVLSPVAGFAKAAAARSFSLYLFHYPVNQLLDLVVPTYNRMGLAAVGAFVARILVILIVVEVAYRLFEARTGAVRAALSHMRPNRAAAA
jgi:peptidoglycan/LPS O-acetylase OafA/YrhL